MRILENVVSRRIALVVSDRVLTSNDERVAISAGAGATSAMVGVDNILREHDLTLFPHQGVVPYMTEDQLVAAFNLSDSEMHRLRQDMTPSVSGGQDLWRRRDVVEWLVHQRTG
jgi:hypothetical protein